MVSVPAWPPRVVEALSPLAAIVAASGFPPDKAAPLPALGKLPPRLRKRAEFLAVRRGETRRGRLFLLEVLDRKDDGEPRVGFTVTKKSGNAVQRNRIRRRLREAIRCHGVGDMAPGNDYVIVGRSDILCVPFSQLTDELTRRIRGKR